MEAIVIGVSLVGIALAVAARMRTARRRAQRNPEELYRLAQGLVDYFNASAHPSHLLESPAFQEGVRHLAERSYAETELTDYATGDNAIIAAMALEALRSRRLRGEGLDALVEQVNAVALWTQHFLLRLLESRFPPAQPLVGRVLVKLDAGNWGGTFSLQFLNEFVKTRVRLGEKLTFDNQLEAVNDDGVKWLEWLLPRIGEDRTKPLLEELRQWSRTRIDLGALNEVGQVWSEDEEIRRGKAIEHEDLLQAVARIETEALGDRVRSVLLVGESGVGKSAIVTTLGRRLQQKGWTIFEAGHSDLLAGMAFMGQLEERLRELVRQLGRYRRVLWVIPDFHALSWAGRHQYGRTSVVDYLLPFIDRGDVITLGETTPAGYQRLLQASSRCRTAMEAVRIEPLGETATLELAHRWVSAEQTGTKPGVSEATLREAWSLAQQFLGDKAAPGNLLQFLSLTWHRLSASGSSGPAEMKLDDLLVTLGELTGLPPSILDEREKLDVTGLRSLFEKRVMGQQEAVDCLVERVAMIKAGLTDPTRPQGVFLFAGPTGTGKTEIAKTLAEFLFGSPDRLLRLDMSEFQDQESLARLLGGFERDQDGISLVDQIRRQPFSVILLDEFEKANRRVWDLFLQVFDDGRLTDRLGRTADFRHSLIILTSNIGSNLPAGLGMGFGENADAFSPQAVQRAVSQGFSREFLNRLDRVVVFRQLSRETMRRILHKELEAAFGRRGLRQRGWAVEWDESAIDFLLEQGFTVDLGARPLARSIDRHVLTPLSMTIVKRQFPEGDQFLFLRRDGKQLAVEFIDPNAPAEDAEEEAEPEPHEPGREMRLEEILLSPRGTRDEVRVVHARLDGVASLIEDNGFSAAKQEALARTSDPAFWDSPDRYAVLGRAEYLDRIESGLRGARSLLDRLEAVSRRKTGSIPRDILGRLSQQIYLLEHGCRDVLEDRLSDAFLLVEAGHEIGEAAAGSNEFARKLGKMYCAWASKRGMRYTVLEDGETEASHGTYRLLMAVSGYGALGLLDSETGLHVFEMPGEKRKPVKRVARVRVLAQSQVAPARGKDALRQQAHQILSSDPTPTPAVVRNYREAPSPLVRDSRRGWRTGKLDRVLAGDFDLMG